MMTEPESEAEATGEPERSESESAARISPEPEPEKENLPESESEAEATGEPERSESELAATISTEPEPEKEKLPEPESEAEATGEPERSESESAARISPEPEPEKENLPESESEAEATGEPERSESELAATISTEPEPEKEKLPEPESEAEATGEPERSESESAARISPEPEPEKENLPESESEAEATAGEPERSESEPAATISAEPEPEKEKLPEPESEAEATGEPERSESESAARISPEPEPEKENLPESESEAEATGEPERSESEPAATISTEPEPEKEKLPEPESEAETIGEPEKSESEQAARISPEPEPEKENLTEPTASNLAESNEPEIEGENTEPEPEQASLLRPNSGGGVKVEPEKIVPEPPASSSPLGIGKAEPEPEKEDSGHNSDGLAEPEAETEAGRVNSIAEPEAADGESKAEPEQDVENAEPKLEKAVREYSVTIPLEPESEPASETNQKLAKNLNKAAALSPEAETETPCVESEVRAETSLSQSKTPNERGKESEIEPDSSAERQTASRIVEHAIAENEPEELIRDHGSGAKLYLARNGSTILGSPESEYFLPLKSVVEQLASGEPMAEIMASIEPESEALSLFNGSGLAEPEVEFLGEPAGEPLSLNESNALIVISSIWIALSVVGNGLVLMALFSTRKLRQVRDNLYLMSICLSSLFVTFLVFPIEIFAYLGVERALLSDFICRWCVFFAHTSVAANLMSQVMASLDNYITICRNRPNVFTWTRTIVGLIAVWILSSVYALRMPLTHGLRQVPGQDFFHCVAIEAYRPMHRVMSLVDVILFYLIPLVCTAFCELSTIRHMYRRAKRKISDKMNIHTVGDSGDQEEGKEGGEGATDKKRLLIMLLILLAGFAFMLLPVTIVDLLIAFEVELSVARPAILIHLTKITAYAYEWVSIFVLVCFSPEIRDAIIARLCCWCARKRNRVTVIIPQQSEGKTLTPSEIIQLANCPRGRMMLIYDEGPNLCDACHRRVDNRQDSYLPPPVFDL